MLGGSARVGAAVRGARPEEAAYPGAAHELPRVWIAVRKNLRNVVENVTVADVAGSRLPPSMAIEAPPSDLPVRVITLTTAKNALSP